MQSKTEKRSFTEVTVVTTRLKGTVVTIFSKNLKIKKLFPTNRLLKCFRSRLRGNGKYTMTFVAYDFLDQLSYLTRKKKEPV